MTPGDTNPTKAPEPRRALGRGLAALLGDQGVPNPAASTPAQNAQNAGASKMTSQQSAVAEAPAPVEATLGNYKVAEVDISKVEPNPDQPRKHFNQARLEELSASLKEHGIVQPIVVRMLKPDHYQIIAGERRWRAAKLGGLSKIPVIIREQAIPESDNDLAALVENIQREDLSPIELAIAYDRMLKAHSFTQESLAQRLGVSRVSVANTLRLLRLPDSIKEMIASKVLSEGHSRALLSLGNDLQMIEMAQQIVEQGLTVRDVEMRVRAKSAPTAPNPNGAQGTPATAGNPKASELVALEDELRNLLGTKVGLRGNLNRGTIEIYYAGRDSLHRLIHQLRATQQ